MRHITALVLGGLSAAALTACTPTVTGELPDHCLGEELGVSLSLEQALPEADVYDLAFTNTSERTCDLHGFPEAVLLNSDSDVIGAPAVQEGTVIAQVFSLNPGGSVHGEVRIGRPELHDPAECGHPLAAAGLQVVPPLNEGGTVIALDDTFTCGSGTVQLLSVGPVTPVGGATAPAGPPSG